MSRFDNEVRVTPSLLDRLLDFEPELTREAASSRAKNLRLFKAAVARDLEWLLNTRRTPWIPVELVEVRRSVVSYGIPDFTSMSLRDQTDRERLVADVAEALRLFEPRLANVRVELEGESDVVAALRFRIEAQLRVEPAPEPVSFDSRISPGMRGFAVRTD